MSPSGLQQARRRRWGERLFVPCPVRGRTREGDAQPCPRCSRGGLCVRVRHFNHEIHDSLHQRLLNLFPAVSPFPISFLLSAQAVAATVFALVNASYRQRRRLAERNDLAAHSAAAGGAGPGSGSSTDSGGESLKSPCRPSGSARKLLCDSVERLVMSRGPSVCQVVDNACSACA